jgi:hypothetical protein
MNPPSKKKFGAASDRDLEKLLKSAAEAPEDERLEMPFGFDTRVVALWRSGTNGNGMVRTISVMVRRVALLATAVIVVAGAGIYLQANRNNDLNEPSANEFAIADSVIQDEFGQ